MPKGIVLPIYAPDPIRISANSANSGDAILISLDAFWGVGIMGGMARVVVPGCPHHITQRGNRCQEMFFGNDDYLA